MSRKGNCLDNAVMENIFGLLKSELLYLQNFDSLAQFRTEWEEYLDYYNNRRIKLNLNGLTPAQHRSQAIGSCLIFSSHKVLLKTLSNFLGSLHFPLLTFFRYYDKLYLKKGKGDSDMKSGLHNILPGRYGETFKAGSFLHRRRCFKFLSYAHDRRV